jgi:putative salt-induced outer membrane protein YdiY
MKYAAPLLVALLFIPRMSHADTPTQLTERAQETAPTEDVTNWSLTGGFVLNTGNTQSWTATTGTNFQLVRGPHAFLLESAFNMSRAALPKDDVPYQTNARNWNSRVRYDYFITPLDAAYVSIRHRWDTFAGLETRLQNQIGYLRNFFRADNHRFWGEVGYDLTYDNLWPDPLIDEATMLPLDGTVLVHAGRVFLGYSNHLNEHVLFETGGEALFNFQVGKDIRFNYDARLVSQLAKRLELELRFRLLFDNGPVPGNVKLDTTTTANLIVTLI